MTDARTEWDAIAAQIPDINSLPESDGVTMFENILSEWALKHGPALLTTITDLRAEVSRLTGEINAHKDAIAEAEPEQCADCRCRAFSKCDPSPPLAAQDVLVYLLKQARNILANSGAESGYCMCGDPIEAHSMGSGHAPVDSHHYYAGRLVEQIDAALASLGEQHD